MTETVHFSHTQGGVPGYPFAPIDWHEEDAERMALEEGIELSTEHREVLRALQEYFSKHDKPDVNIRELHDALDERFHSRGGMKHLYLLFPSGPVAQGCQLAGLPVPPGAIDLSFGSVQ
ncbi:MAG: TusE/DsrC/DsvC family sulfur relay protein [Gammaproteobacteria bacterium]|nr:TusE/DsrC/DsvC family sulfur relay protein [Gammaproteobacteria bacterium]